MRLQLFNSSLALTPQKLSDGVFVSWSHVKGLAMTALHLPSYVDDLRFFP